MLLMCAHACERMRCSCGVVCMCATWVVVRVINDVCLSRTLSSTITHSTHQSRPRRGQWENEERAVVAECRRGAGRGTERRCRGRSGAERREHLQREASGDTAQREQPSTACLQTTDERSLWRVRGRRAHGAGPGAREKGARGMQSGAAPKVKIDHAIDRATPDHTTRTLSRIHDWTPRTAGGPREGRRSGMFVVCCGRKRSWWVFCGFHGFASIRDRNGAAASPSDGRALPRVKVQTGSGRERGECGRAGGGRGKAVDLFFVWCRGAFFSP